jgi:ABC-type transporter Mla subunit MlaD
VFDQVMNWLYILTGSFALITFVAIVIFVLASRKQGSRKRGSSE